jgi:hypothetical protein
LKKKYITGHFTPRDLTRVLLDPRYGFNQFYRVW